MIGFLLAFAAIVGEFIRLPDTLNDYPKTKFTPNDTTYTVNTPLNSNMIKSKALIHKVKSGHYRFNNLKKGTPYRVFCVNWQLIFKLFTHPSLHESCFNLYKKLTTKKFIYLRASSCYICILQLVPSTFESGT